MFPCVYHIVRKYLSQCINILTQNNKRILILTVEQKFLPVFWRKNTVFEMVKIAWRRLQWNDFGNPKQYTINQPKQYFKYKYFSLTFIVYANPVILYRPFYDINLILFFMWAMWPIGLFFHTGYREFVG